MGLSSVRGDAKKDRNKTSRKGDSTEPLPPDKIKKFDYVIGARTLKTLIGLKAKSELRKIAERGELKERRIEAIHGLVKIGDKDAIPVLEEIGKTDPEEKVKKEAGEAVQKLRGNDIRAELEDIISDTALVFDADDFPEVDYDVELAEKAAKRADIRTFKRGNESKIYAVTELALGDESFGIRKKAVEALIESEIPGALDTVELYLRSSGEIIEEEMEFKGYVQRKLEENTAKLKEKTAIETIEAFKKGDSSRLEKVTKLAFGDESKEIKKEAIGALMESKEKEALDAILLFMIVEDEVELRRPILEELAELKYDKFLPTFLEVVENDKDEGIRALMIETLSMYSGPKVIAALENVAKNENFNEKNRKRAEEVVRFLKMIQKSEGLAKEVEG